MSVPDTNLRELGHRVLIGSGAMGTCLRQGGAVGDGPVEILNLKRPDAVRGLHRAYREAGSRILVANTFAANTLAFSEAGLHDVCLETNRAGVALAREAASSECMVWASVGPLGLGLRLDDYPDADLVDIYRSQCEGLQGADALLLETFTAPREAQAALDAAALTGLPIVFQIGHTGRGPARWEHVNRLLRAAHRAGAVAVGANCQHPDDIVRVAAYIAAHTDLPLTAAPNAGQPRIQRGLVEYEYAPNDFTVAAEALADLGVSVIGGCCGTTPDHIRRMAQTLARRPVVSRSPNAARPARAPLQPERKDAAPNPIRALMHSPRCVISVEIRAERTRSLEQIVQGAARVAAAGADLFDVPDNPGATVGRDATVTAARLQKDLQVPSICHLGVTQSNLMRLHSMLIGSWDSGLRGVLAVTGDAPSMGHLGHLAHRVTDVRSSVELLRLIRGLREGKLINGEPLADAPDFCAGCAFGSPIPAQVRWLKAKLDAGAEFVFSQPVFTVEAYQRLRDAVAELPIRFFPGILPLVSLRNATLLAHGRIPGIVVPPEVVAAFTPYTALDDQRRHGLDRAAQLALEVAADARGLYLIMPFGPRCYEETARIVRYVKGNTAGSSRKSEGCSE